VDKALGKSTILNVPTSLYIYIIEIKKKREPKNVYKKNFKEA